MAVKPARELLQKVIFFKRRAAKSILPREYLRPISFGHKGAYLTSTFQSSGGFPKSLAAEFRSPAQMRQFTKRDRNLLGGAGNEF
jgi:hypothetical protein